MTVKAGEPTQVHFESVGRLVTGKITIAGTNAPVLTSSIAALNSIPSDLLLKLRNENQEERQKFIDSPEFKEAQKNSRYFRGAVMPDGSFRVNDVEPGKYYLDIQPEFRGLRPGQRPTNVVFYASSQPLIVPSGETAQINSSSKVDVSVASAASNSPNAVVGGTAPLTNTASGSAPLFYQWYKSDTNADTAPFDAGTVELKPYDIPASKP